MSKNDTLVAPTLLGAPYALLIDPGRDPLSSEVFQSVMARRRISAGTRSMLCIAALALLALAWLAAGPAGAAFSDANGRIALSQQSGRFTDIWVMDSDGSGKARLTCGRRSASPSWSPDGQKIAFGRWGRGAGLWVMDADGRNPTRVGGDGSFGLRWSPTSERLAFPVTVADEQWEVEVLNADGSGGAARGPLDGETLTRQAWSPDGGRLVLEGGWIFDPESGETRHSIGDRQSVWSSRDVIAFVLDDDVWTVNPDGSGETRLTDDPDRDGEPLWSPDGQRIAFTRTTRDFRNVDLWVMDADGTNQTLLAAGGFSHLWSPDGERIAFLTSHDGGLTRDLWVTKADGTDPRRLARGRATGHGLSPLDSHVWSPDGEKIVFAKDYTAGERARDVWVVNADGSDQTLLAEGAERPDWQPLPSGTSLGPPPSQLCFERVRRNKRRGIARLVVEVPRPGRVILHRRPGVKRFARAHRDESGGRVALRVRPRGKARQRLNRRNRVRVRAQVTYRPWVGEPRTKVRRVRLVKR